MKRHGLGRFRVTQKADLRDPRDGYRSENANAEDWIMIGNHDTEPLTRVLERWEKNGSVENRAGYLAGRLAPRAGDGARRQRLATAFASDRKNLVLAMVADLFASRAKNVMVFFADLYGERTIYNRPGVVDPENWRLRVPLEFETVYASRRRSGEAPCLFSALALALRAKGDEFVRAHADVLAALDARAFRVL
jgi:hypothetical protein